MKKLYLCSIVLFLFAGMQNLSAQKKGVERTKIEENKNFKLSRFANRTNAPGCDTINFPPPSTWTPTIYGFGANSGYLTGTNKFGDREKASYFDDSASLNIYLTKVFIYFTNANSTNPANLSKIIPIKVYNEDLGSTTETVLATATKTFAEIKADVDNDLLTEVTFSSAVLLPASKRFYISVDVSNLVWDSLPGGVKDSLAILSTRDTDSLLNVDGYFVEKLRDSLWITSADSYGIDLSLYIFPLLSTNATCALTLPITLAQFTGERLTDKNVLKWTTQTEINNKGFDVQRSIDGITYTTIAFIPSKAAGGNSSSPLNYSYDDVKPFNSDGFYRLKQVDKDERSTVSKIVLLKGLKISSLQLYNVYPNPARSILNMIVSSPNTNKINLRVTDLVGKTIQQQSATVLTGDNKLTLNVVNLPAGTYFVKAICADGCETAIHKFVKQ